MGIGSPSLSIKFRCIGRNRKNSFDLSINSLDIELLQKVKYKIRIRLVCHCSLKRTKITKLTLVSIHQTKPLLELNEIYKLDHVFVTAHRILNHQWQYTHIQILGLVNCLYIFETNILRVSPVNKIIEALANQFKKCWQYQKSTSYEYDTFMALNWHTPSISSLNRQRYEFCLSKYMLTDNDIN